MHHDINNVGLMKSCDTDTNIVMPTPYPFYLISISTSDLNFAGFHRIKMFFLIFILVMICESKISLALILVHPVLKGQCDYSFKVPLCSISGFLPPLKFAN